MFEIPDSQKFCYCTGKPNPFKKDESGRTLYPYECELCGMQMMS
ncbi:hypothetical protein LCGC14_0586490 [marine sediment metagenome]|uniref:Uncharacterized protein n=1 Tax=marine sediment metagenome TaxID=412755 RepID=A0A0F9UN63_9ZZZZ